jgi:tRNA (mo5U34)-methyltransferase
MTTTQQDLQARIDSFDRWHYRFEFDGGLTTPIFDHGHINRHEQRRKYFFEPLVKLCGGSLAGRRVLDLGCNAGYWSLQAADAGADFVLGIDGRQMHVDQANLVFSAKGVPASRYRFDCANVFGGALAEQFDVVLCLGLMYHVAKPLELFELMAATGAELLVVDTGILHLPGSFFRVRQEVTLDDPRAAVDYATVMIPTRQAVIDLARQFGYQAVTLEPDFADDAGMADYIEGDRRAFICSMTTPLTPLNVETPSALALWTRAVTREIGKRARKALGRAQRSNVVHTEAEAAILAERE